jgi:hypothetical protein
LFWDKLWLPPWGVYVLDIWIPWVSIVASKPIKSSMEAEPVARPFFLLFLCVCGGDKIIDKKE